MLFNGVCYLRYTCYLITRVIYLRGVLFNDACYLMTRSNSIYWGVLFSHTCYLMTRVIYRGREVT